MRKNPSIFGKVLFISLSFSLTLGLTAQLRAEADTKLTGFDAIRLGSSYDQLKSEQKCDAASPAVIKDGAQLGVTTTICPAGPTFAMATLLDQKVMAVAVNWVSWKSGALLQDPQLMGLPATFRKNYGIPTATIAYESQFGNPEADALCRDPARRCQIHIWKAEAPARVASLVYAALDNKEVPLLFSINDLTAEKMLQDRVFAHSQKLELASRKTSQEAH